MTRTKWFDRPFQFDFLDGTFPGIIERLEGTPLRLEHMVRSMPHDYLTKQPANAWTIQQHVGHLFDLEELWRGRIIDMETYKPVMRPADLENLKTEKANHNAAAISDLLSQFRLAREGLVEVCRSLSDKAETLNAGHPRLEKPMRLIDLMFFVAEHDDHHLALITDLKQSFR